jgi:tetratricopeptide (TPR) repeat protein
LRFAPDNVRVLQLAGAIELQSGSALQAATFLNKALRGAPHRATQQLLVQAHLRAGQSEEALRQLAPLLQVAQPDAQTLALTAQAHLVKGDSKRAEEYFSRAVKANPDDIKSRTALAMAQIGKGSTELGYSQLEAIAAEDKGTTADLALVSTQLRQGHYDAALKALDAFDAKQPNTALAAHLRGMIHLSRQEVGGARQQFERALEIEPVYLPAVLGLVAMDLAEKKPEQARKRFDNVLA